MENYAWQVIRKIYDTKREIHISKRFENVATGSILPVESNLSSEKREELYTRIVPAKIDRVLKVSLEPVRFISGFSSII